MNVEKKRLDLLVLEKGYAESREKAKALIMAGEILVNGEKEDKAGALFPEDSEIEFKGKGLRYVSRGGLKLEKALSFFEIDLSGRVCLDIGASTGGFTDCMLQNGAARVYAVDVGYGQLAWKLRTDDRVIPMEKTNFRYLKSGDLPEEPDFASCDVSFISLSKILPAAFSLLNEKGSLVCLIKPQFEAGRGLVGKKGVVRDPAVHEQVITNVFEYVRSTGFYPYGLSFSPIKGPEGNTEFLLYAGKEEEKELTGDIDSLIRETVKEANGKDH